LLVVSANPVRDNTVALAMMLFDSSHKVARGIEGHPRCLLISWSPDLL